MKDHQGRIVAKEHKCILNADVIQFIEDRIKDKYEKKTAQQAEAEINRLKEQIKLQQDSLHEPQATVEARDQSIDQLNISLNNIEDKLKNTKATIQQCSGKRSSSLQNTPESTKRPKFSERQKQGCQTVEMKFWNTGPKFRVKWKYCGAITLHQADEIAQQFPNETRSFLSELKENGSEQIDTLYKRDIQELVDPL